ncbi:hypothetical protein QC761_0032650 [Podospora bellae-mahoneyi]|uniref:Uncharacterized protein n=1 Tax=Podospora bellae-mahoneyi TaxID=2093777 RepID=A0ABR0FNA3_9PEZI|nr:hypothetical protein QC761_0032650 [Podospora bellae-mahoneyi]
MMMNSNSPLHIVSHSGTYISHLSYHRVSRDCTTYLYLLSSRLARRGTLGIKPILFFFRRLHRITSHPRERNLRVICRALPSFLLSCGNTRTRTGMDEPRLSVPSHFVRPNPPWAIMNYFFYSHDGYQGR